MTSSGAGGYSDCDLMDKWDLIQSTAVPRLDSKIHATRDVMQHRQSSSSRREDASFNNDITTVAKTNDLIQEGQRSNGLQETSSLEALGLGVSHLSRDSNSKTGGGISVRAKGHSNILHQSFEHYRDHQTADLPNDERLPSDMISHNDETHNYSRGLLSKVSLFELLAITSFNFPYGFICGTFGLWLLPAEANRLFPDTQSLTLGLSLGVVGLTQLVCPVAGKISDMHHSKTQFGKRRPYIVWGCVLAVVSSIGMYTSSLCNSGYPYYLFLFLGMVGLNVTYAVQSGLVPDMLNRELQGRSSGLVAVHTLLGSGTGFGLVIGTSNFDFHFVYYIFVVLVTVSCVLICDTAWRLEARKNMITRFHRFPSHDSARRLSQGSISGKFQLSSIADGETSKHQSCGLQGAGAETPTAVHEASRLLVPSTTRQQTSVLEPASRTEAESFSTLLSTDDSSTKETPEPDSLIELGACALTENESRSNANRFSSDSIRTSNAAPNNFSKHNSHEHLDLSRAWNSSINLEEDKREGSSYIAYGHRGTGTQRGVGLATLEGSGPAKFTFAHIVDAFKIDTSESYDFFWVFIGRALYYIGVSVQAFMLYYLRDVIGTRTEAERQLQIGCIALLAQAVAALVAFPVGLITDRHSEIGKKPLIFLACGVMSLVYIGFLFAPVFGKYGIHFVMFTAVIYGAGNGCFLAVDYALALATLPNKENVTHALGIWGVSAFIGSAIGPMLWGLIIESVGKDPETQHYYFIGYVAMLLGGVISTFLAGGVIALINGVA